MKTFAVRATKWTTAMALVPFGLFLSAAAEARAAEPVCANTRMVKNLMAPTYRASCAAAVVPHELSKKEVRRLTATAETREDHLKLARYYTSEADRLDAEALAYEQAATAYGSGPIVKNLMAPSTPGRYEFFAKGLRNEAKSDRALAASHEEMARASVASL